MTTNQITPMGVLPATGFPPWLYGTYAYQE